MVLLCSTLIPYLPFWPGAGAGGGKPGCDGLDAVGLPEGRAEAGAEDGVGIVRFGDFGLVDETS